MIKTLNLGDIVISKAGRDTNKMFVVTQVVNQDFVLICNGKLKDIDRPKLKRAKHLRVFAHSENLAEKLAQSNIENVDIINELDSLTQNY